MFDKAIARFNELNSQDPARVEQDGIVYPKELLAAQRLESWVLRVDPDASPALRLAARSQHLMRFLMPRRDYPEGRVGYLKWRKDMSRRHADLAAGVLSDSGFAPELIAEVRKIHQKEGLKSHPDTQKMEDALCLSFLSHEFAEFCEKHPDEKVIEIVQKSWLKMSELGHELALQIPFSGRAKELILLALTPTLAKS
jgi:hypothetical protein